MNNCSESIVFLCNAFYNCFNVVTMWYRITNRHEYIIYDLNLSKILRDCLIPFTDGLQFRTELSRSRIHLHQKELMNFIPHLVGVNATNNPRKNRIRECREKPCDQQRVLLFPFLISWINQIQFSIIRSEIVQRTRRINEKTLKFMATDYSFNLLFPWEKIFGIQFQSNLLSECGRSSIWDLHAICIHIRFENWSSNWSSNMIRTRNLFRRGLCGSHCSGSMRSWYHNRKMINWGRERREEKREL